MRTTKAVKDPKGALLELLKIKKLMQKNTVMVVFDGFSGSLSGEGRESGNTNIIYSCSVSADEKIRRMLEGAKNPANIVVVSDDKEVKLSARINRARSMGIEEFLAAPKPRPNRKEGLPEAELSAQECRKINDELEKLWLN